MDLGLEGKVAIITGGSDGIGKGIATSLAAEGANVAICARREEGLRQAAEEIGATARGQVLTVAGDVTRPDDVGRLVAATVSRFGRVDILVNNAGSSNANYFEDVTDEVWQQDLDLKLMASIRLCRLCIPEMRKVGGGRIINLTMIGGKQPGAKSVPTSVSRAAGIALTKALSKDYAADNILVNTVCVGIIESGQWERRYEQARDQYQSLEQFYRERSKQVPLQRFGLPREVGDLVAFLASGRAGYITGDAINIDGGTSAVV